MNNSEAETSDDEFEQESRSFRRNGSKFQLERSSVHSPHSSPRGETVTTPIFSEDEEDDFFQGIRQHDEGSEIVFNNKKKNEGGTGRGRSRKRSRSKCRSSTRSRSRPREKKHRKKHSRSSDSDSSPEYHRKPKKSKKKKKRQHSYTSSSESDDDKVSRIVKQVVETLKASKGKSNPNIELIKLSKAQHQSISNDQSTKQTETTGTKPDKVVQETVKSPSDTMIFTPAVKFSNKRDQQRIQYNDKFGSPTLIAESIKNKMDEREDDNTNSDLRSSLIDKFLTSFRIGEANQGDKTRVSKGDQPGGSGLTAEQKLEAERRAHAKEIADRTVLEAERNKAVLQLPEGRSPNNENNMGYDTLPKGAMVPFVTTTPLDNDDDFFHIICHIDPQIIIKIKKGEFVELEKLLQKPEHLNYETNDRKSITIEREGEKFAIPCKIRDNKITNVRKWEQAFRVYATIYSQANPHRAAEIWQYVDIINQAAYKFNWESVAKYDFIFRHLMEKKPHRSWARTYTQVWTMELCAGTSRDSKESGRNSDFRRNGGNKSTPESSQQSWKDRCCWKFNKTGSCPYGKDCRFDHRCTFCGSYNHPSMNCDRKSSHGRRKETKSSSSKKDSKR